MFERLSLIKKFSVLGALALLMAALPTGLLFKHSLSGIEDARREASGMAPVIALQKVLQLTQRHRDVAAGMLGGNQALAAKRPAVLEALHQAVEALESRMKAADAGAPLLAAWAGHKQTLAALEHSVTQSQLKPAESSAQHTGLITGMLRLNSELLDEFGLSLVLRADTYAMIMASFVHATAMTEELGQMRALGSGFLATRNLPAEGRMAPKIAPAFRVEAENGLRG